MIASKIKTVKRFEGTILKCRYRVDNLVGKGTFGKVYQLNDVDGLDDGLPPLVVKASKDASMLYNELISLDLVN